MCHSHPFICYPELSLDDAKFSLNNNMPVYVHHASGSIWKGSFTIETFRYKPEGTSIGSIYWGYGDRWYK